METTIDSTITGFDRENCQLQNSLFGRSHHGQPVCMDELIKTLFILWCDSCAWLSRTWLLFHVTISTAEMYYPPPHCAHIHCLVSINIQQASVNVNGCRSFHMEKFNSTPLLHMHSHVRHHSVGVPLCCHLYRATTCNGISVGRLNLCCHPTNIRLICSDA